MTMDERQRQNLENAHLLIEAISGAISRGCIHRNKAGKELKTTPEVLDALRKEGGVLVQEPSAEVTERLDFIKRCYPKDRCYRNREDSRHHFKIHSYDVGKVHQCDEPGCTHSVDPTRVSVTVIHGSDSSLPGVAAAGFDPQLLMACECGGRWQFPTPQQIAATKAYIEPQRRRRS